MWEHCDGRLSRPRSHEGLALTPAAVERAVDALHECGLLDEAPVAETGATRAARRPPESRRSGGVAFAAPLVYSVAVRRGGGVLADPAPVVRNRYLTAAPV